MINKGDLAGGGVYIRSISETSAEGVVERQLWD